MAEQADATVAPSPSPFDDEGVQYAWDSTSLGWLKTCPRLYQYSMLEGWTPKGERVHLKFGIHYHSALEHYDVLRAQGASHSDAEIGAVQKALVDTAGWESEHNLKTRETLVRSVAWYLDHFGDKDPATTITLGNGKAAVELSYRYQVNEDLVLCGHLDRVADFAGDLYIVDRKTTGTTPGAYFFDGFNPDNQMSGYTWAGQIIYNLPIKGVMIDAAQIAVGFTRFERGFTFRTTAQLDEWMRATIEWTNIARRFTRIGFWPQNDKSCNQYGGCAFRKICSKDPAVREAFLETDFEKRPWNPLEAR
jgi:hypothetical protein